jgi:hypothetical protein
MATLPRLLQPKYSRTRLVIALAAAATADVLQFVLGPVGWVFFDDVIDVAAMAAVTLALGFHVLFLPTFLIELVPVADMVPTWTASVIAVAVFRKRDETLAS